METLVLEMLKSRWGRTVIGIVMAAFGTFMWLLAYPQLSDVRALRSSSQRTLAEVIDARIGTGYHGFTKDYDIRYRFRLDPNGPWYTRSEKGPVARKELWATVPKEQWEIATTTFQVEVEYLPSDPWVNEIAGKAKDEVFGIYGLIVFAILMLFGGSMMAFHAIFRWHSPAPVSPDVERNSMGQGQSRTSVC